MQFPLLYAACNQLQRSGIGQHCRATPPSNVSSFRSVSWFTDCFPAHCIFHPDFHVSFVPAHQVSNLKLRGKSVVVGGDSMRHGQIAPAFSQA